MRSSRAAALALTFVLASCGTPGETTDPPANSSAYDGEWVLIEGSGGGERLKALDTHQVTFEIDGRRAGGIAACNHYGGRIEVTDSRLELEGLSMTEMACEEPAMELEYRYLEALNATTEIARVGQELVLKGPGVELRFTALRPTPTT